MHSKNSGPIRQLSFNSDSRKKVLKSQFSEDLSSASQISDLSYNSSLNIRKQSISHDQPPPAKLAWIDNANQNYKVEKHGSKNEEGIIAKKCKESKRPSTGKLVKQVSLPKDSILLSHQQLAERLRQAWKEREKSKQNLNIFLAQNVKDRSDEEHNNDVTDTESMIVNDNQAFDKLVNKPKVILPLKPDLRPNNEIDYKKIFQKRLRRAYSIDDQLKCSEHFPVRSDFKRSVVVIPWQENKSIKKVKENPTSQVKMDAEEIDVCVPKIDQQFQDVKIEEEIINSEDNLNMENENLLNEPAKPIDVIIRPLTANSKREGFRNRTNTAFNESSNTEKIKPPLIRASSVPVKSSQARMKLFNPVKRKIKSAAKRKDKITVQKVSSDDESETNLKDKKYQRNVSFSGTEVITMMSLISPEQSDAEEHVEVDIEIQKLNPVPVKPQIEEHIEKFQHTKSLTLRKTVKSVSFQQSSIHAVRSFSASFPARRGSIATSLIVNNEEVTKNFTGYTQARRTSIESMSRDNVREQKRRLLRSKSATSDSSTNEDKEKIKVSNDFEESNKELQKSASTNIDKEVNPVVQTQKPISNENDTQPQEMLKSQEALNTTLENVKEKQCWDTFCKMNKKGVNISFDTILRGMLTPTEYRLRRKSIATLADSNTEHINDT